MAARFLAVCSHHRPRLAFALHPFLSIGNRVMMPTRPAPTVRSPLSRRDALRFLGLAGTGALFGPTLARAAGEASSTAPAFTGAQPGFYHFKIGSIDAVALNDGGFAPPVKDSPFGVGEPTEKVVEALREGFAPTDRVHLQFNVLLLRIDGQLALIDAGSGSLNGDAGGKLVGRLAEVGVRPEQISTIVITHMHGDHFGGLLDKAGQPVFKNARLFLHRVEHAYWSEKGDANVQKYLNAFKDEWQLVSGGEKVLGALEIVEAFGHTPGHSCVRISSGPEQLFHLADTVHSHVVSFSHPEWVMRFDVQSDAAIATRKRMLELCAGDGRRVFGGHLPFPALGHVRRAGRAYEYLIEPWMFA